MMKTLHLANRTISSRYGALIMGIVNCTPDSFYEKSRGGTDLALQLIDEGADIIDLGGESTRPGASYVDEKEEMNRLVPVIREIRKSSNVAISVDTRKKSVMEACLDAGADILNDVSALEDDPAMAQAAAQWKIPVILMHKRGLPSTMQSNTSYRDVFEEVNSYLMERTEYALSCGIQKDRIIVDPGIGFAKNLEQNGALIARCGELCGGTYPVLMALSRKTCIREITGRNTDGALIGTVAANLISVMRGASMVRVHDVASCLDSLAVLNFIQEIV